RRLESPEIEQHASHFHGTALAGDSLAENHANLLVVGTEHQPLAVLDELAAKQDVLKVIEPGELPERIDGRETARPCLRASDGEANEDEQEDSGSEPRHTIILLFASPFGRPRVQARERAAGWRSEPASNCRGSRGTIPRASAAHRSNRTPGWLSTSHCCR